MAQSASEHFQQLADAHRRRAAAASNPDRRRNHEGLAAGYEGLAQDALDGVTRRPKPATAKVDAA